MTGAQALTMLMARMNRSQAALRANALLEMILFQQMLEKSATLPDFLFSYDSSVSLSASNRQFTLPSNFLRFENEDDSVWILDNNSEYQKMTRVGFDDVEFERTETGSLPLKYAMRGLYGYTFPIPTVARTIKMNYFATGATIADDTVETVWLKHAPDLIVGGTGTIVNALYVKDQEATVAFATMEAGARRRLSIEQVAREESERSRRMG